MSITHEWRSYDVAQDDWDTPSNTEELREAIESEGIELWLNRIDGDWVSDKAQVLKGKLPEYMEEEGYKVPRRFHDRLQRIAEA